MAGFFEIYGEPHATDNDVVYDERGYPYRRATPRGSLGSEIVKTGVGAVADVVDAITGLPGLAARGLNYVGNKTQWAGPQSNIPVPPSTGLGEMVPQPSLVGNQIIREAAPMLFGGGEAKVPGQLARRAAPVVRSPVTTAPVNAMMKSGKAVDAGMASKPMGRREVLGGLAATAATAAVAPKVINKLLKETKWSDAAVAKFDEQLAASPVVKAARLASVDHIDAFKAHSKAARLHKTADARFQEWIDSHGSPTDEAAAEIALDHAENRAMQHTGEAEKSSGTLDTEFSEYPDEHPLNPRNDFSHEDIAKYHDAEALKHIKEFKRTYDPKTSPETIREWNKQHNGHYEISPDGWVGLHIDTYGKGGA